MILQYRTLGVVPENSALVTGQQCCMLSAGIDITNLNSGFPPSEQVP